MGHLTIVHVNYLFFHDNQRGDDDKLLPSQRVNKAAIVKELLDHNLLFLYFGLLSMYHSGVHFKLKHVKLH